MAILTDDPYAQPVEAWSPFGYDNALEYDPIRSIVRFGAYEFHANDAKLPIIGKFQGGSVADAMSKWESSYTKNWQDEKRKSTNVFGQQWTGGSIADMFYGPQMSIQDMAKMAQNRPIVIGTQKLQNGLFEYTLADKSANSYEFIDRISSMANALSAQSAGDSDQRPRRRTASGAR